MMDKLTHIDLSYSPLIESTPDFTSTPNLKVLILCYCENLKVVHQSLGALERLVRLDLAGTGIRELPSSIEHLHNLESLCLIDCKNFASLPGTVGKLKCLTRFTLSGCSKLEKLPEELGNLECLDVLFLKGTGIKEVPSSIEHLSGLRELFLLDCKNLRSLPSAICKLKCLTLLYLSGCSKLEKLPEELGNLECLDVLDLKGTGIKEVPSSIEHLSGLRHLFLSDCKNLRSLPSAICKLKCLTWLDLSGCSKLEKLPEELGSLERLSMLYLDGTAIRQPPLSIRFLNNLTTLKFSRSSQSRTSILQYLPTRKRKRQEDDSTWSLVLAFVSDLRKLVWLRLASCNMLDVAIPSDLEPCSLESLNLGGNCFVQLPSLDQLSKLRCLTLDGCKMLEALPNLPSSIKELSADDCPSLRLSVDRITNSRKLNYVSFSNCLQLLKEYNGESKNEAISTLWQHKIEESHLVNSPEFSIILPGGDIPKWFSKQTTGHSILLELPSNWSTDNFKGLWFCVVIDPFKWGYKAPFKYFARREKVSARVFVKVTVRTRSNHQYAFHIPDYTNPFMWRQKDISMEHVFLHFASFTDSWWRPSTFADINDWCEIQMEVSIENSSPNTARVTKWGMDLVPKYQTI